MGLTEAKTIRMEPDGPAILAQRLVHRLAREGILPHGNKRKQVAHRAHVIEILADEIHQDVIDGTLRKGE